MGVIKFIKPENIDEVVRACKEAEIVGLDTETYAYTPLIEKDGSIQYGALHPRYGTVRLIQLAVQDTVWILDCRRFSPLLLSPIFDGTVRFIGHNLPFDLRFLWSVGLILPHGKNLFCSMIAGQLLDAGLYTPKGYFSLAEMLKRVCNITVDKSMQTSNWGADHLSQEQLRYAAHDVSDLIPLYYALKKRIVNEGLERTMLLEMRALPGMVWMTMQGVEIDVDGWKALADKNTKKVENLETALGDLTESGDLFGYSFINWRSPKQVEETFNQRFKDQGKTYRVRVPVACQEKRCNMYGQMYEYEDPDEKVEGVELIPVCQYHSTFRYEQRPVTLESTGSRVLAQLAADGDQLAALLLQYRKTVKARDTYGYAFLDKYLWLDNRIYPEYHQLGAGATGRMSSSNPNGQNIPHSFEFRSLFIPGSGNSFALADLSQIELRICVEISRDPAGWNAYVVTKEDLHRSTASLILGVDLTDKSEAGIKRATEARQVAKSLNFGLIFGAGSETLRLYAQQAFNVSLSAKEAERLRNAWRTTYAGIVAWQRKAGNGPAITHTLGGRRRINVFKFTEKLNTPVQGTGIDGLKAAVALIYENRHKFNEKAVPVAYVHDEILFQAPHHAADDTSKMIAGYMEKGMRYFLKEVPVVAEPKTLDNWGEK